jgi:hypothetical protein
MWQIMTGRINNNNVEFEGFMLDSNLRDVWSLNGKMLFIIYVHVCLNLLCDLWT